MDSLRAARSSASRILPGSGNGGILLSDRKFGDFEVKIDMNHDWGPCSGFFLRSNDKGQCFQVMVDFHDAGNVGHIYGEGTGAFNNRAFDINGQVKDGKLVAITGDNVRKPSEHGCVYTCTPGEWVKAWRVGKWNTLKVRCVGKYPRITTWLNGQKICEFDGATFKQSQYDREKVHGILGDKGSIAVQGARRRRLAQGCESALAQHPRPRTLTLGQARSEWRAELQVGFDLVGERLAKGLAFVEFAGDGRLAVLGAVAE